MTRPNKARALMRLLSYFALLPSRLIRDDALYVMIYKQYPEHRGAFFSGKKRGGVGAADWIINIDALQK